MDCDPDRSFDGTGRSSSRRRNGNTRRIGVAEQQITARGLRQDTLHCPDALPSAGLGQGPRYLSRQLIAWVRPTRLIRVGEYSPFEQRNVSVCRDVVGLKICIFPDRRP